MNNQTPAVRPNLLDRALAWIAPTLALRRAQARAGLDLLAAFGVERQAATRKGSLGNWFPRRVGTTAEARDRQMIADRAADLAANDPHAASIVNAVPLAVVGGQGVMPQSRPWTARLGLTPEASAEWAAACEWAFETWAAECDLGGRLHFADIQFQVTRTVMTYGEFLALPVMRQRPGERFGLKLQTLDPLRLCTPCDLTADPDIRDGLRLDGSGGVSAYYVADPDLGGPDKSRRYRFFGQTARPYSDLDSGAFSVIPARRGHRPALFHCFPALEPEQLRGVSPLAPVMKFVRDKGDYLDFEIIGAIVAASTPLFISTERPEHQPQIGRPGPEPPAERTQYEEITPGRIMYGNPGERPELLSPARPSNTFAAFVEVILRSIGAAVGLPYEVVAKDFSRTNYSSARAALLEAWRVYMRHRHWLIRSFCAPVWRMVIEEAWLRGMIRLPKGGPDFYAALPEYTAATWIGPSRGHVDPTKEMDASLSGLAGNVLTLADVAAEQGQDWEDLLEQRARERRRMAELGLREGADANPAGCLSNGEII